MSSLFTLGIFVKIALYVHDLRLEIGHSNSLIELMRHLPQEFQKKITEIEVVTYTSDDLKLLFGDFNCKLSHKRVPKFLMKPFIFKSIFYQLYTFIYNRCFQSPTDYRIGIGISCLDVNAVSVQFIHHQWTEAGLKQEKGYFWRGIYKTLLFKYYECCENFLFQKKGLKVFSPAQFLNDYLLAKYPALLTKTIYSGVNLQRFQWLPREKSEVLTDLSALYPQLAAIDLARPLFLFVGAFERKGLDQALEIIQQYEKPQFIVIGRGSMGKDPVWPEGIDLYRVHFTREVVKFYQLADVFIFPTLYEPFGLVLFEAMAMGLVIVTRRENVGASELLEGLPQVNFIDNPQFSLPSVFIQSKEDRENLIKQRIDSLPNVSWKHAGESLAEFLSRK